MKRKHTLKYYHKKYPARPGDTVEKFERYEEFCKLHPLSTFKSYDHWYSHLKTFMTRKKR